jgi:ABC-type nitrate/sulfonate/bicarbonate transport system substrate-binding protein
MNAFIPKEGVLRLDRTFSGKTKVLPVRIRVPILLCFLILVGTAEEIPAASASANIVLAYASMVARTSFIWIAKDQGFFAKYGIDPELILISRGPVLIAGLTSGGVTVGNTGGTAALNAAVGGIDLKLVATFNSRWINNLVARPGIQSVKDLAKKRFGLSSLGGTQWMGTMLWLEHLGLDAQKDDMRFLVVGDQTLLAQALENGIIDVASLDSALSRRFKQKGYTVLTDSTKVNLPIVSQGLVVTGEYLHKQPRMVEGVLRALIEGLAFTVAPANKPVVLKTLRNKLGIADPSLLEEGYQEILTGLDRKPYPSLEGIKNIQRLMKLREPRFANVNVENIVDKSLMEKLETSGFIDQVYGGSAR